MIQKLIRTDRAEHQRGVASASTCGHRGLRRTCSSEASRGSLPEEELALQGLGNKGVREVQPRRQIRFMQSGREPARMPCGACLWRHEAAPVARGRARALRAAAGIGIAFVCLTPYPAALVSAACLILAGTPRPWVFPRSIASPTTLATSATRRLLTPPCEGTLPSKSQSSTRFLPPGPRFLALHLCPVILTAH